MFIVVVGSLSFAVFIFKAGFNFYHHSYYIVPFVPVMSLLVAYALVQIKKQSIVILLLAAIVSESIANQIHDFRIKDSELYKLSLESIADKVSLPSDLIAINGEHNPQLMYFAHRKGWLIATGKAEDAVFMKQITNLGCKYLFFDKNEPAFGDMSAYKNSPVVFENGDFVVYSLRN